MVIDEPLFYWGFTCRLGLENPSPLLKKFLKHSQKVSHSVANITMKLYDGEMENCGISDHLVIY